MTTPHRALLLTAAVLIALIATSAAHAQSQGDACSVSGKVYSIDTPGVPALYCNGASLQNFFIPKENAALACTAAREGALQYIAATDTWNFCNGTAWTAFVGVGTPAGADRQIQFNNSGAFAADSTFVYTSAGFVGIGTAAPGSALDVKGTLRLSGATSGYVGLAPAAAAGSTTYTLPTADGSSGTVLTTNGSGALSWSSGGSGYTDVTSNLIGWWKFDESSGTTAADSSGNGRNGTVNGGGTWQSTGGQVGGALACDGTNDYVSIPDDAAWDITNVTLSAWVNKKTDNHASFAEILSRQKGTASGDYYIFEYNGNFSEEVAFGIDGAGVPKSTEVLGEMTTIGEINTWVHYAGVYDGATIRIYRNGQQIYAKTHTGTPTAEITRLVICAADNDATGIPNEWLNAWVDDVRIYNAALTPAQIYSIYRAAGGIP